MEAWEEWKTKTYGFLPSACTLNFSNNVPLSLLLGGSVGSEKEKKKVNKLNKASKQWELGEIQKNNEESPCLWPSTSRCIRKYPQLDACCEHFDSSSPSFQAAILWRLMDTIKLVLTLLFKEILKHSQQSHAISDKQIVYVISVLHNLMDACWWRHEAITMHLCKLSMGLEKLKFHQIMSIFVPIFPHTRYH